jgi:hypothetical protein
MCLFQIMIFYWFYLEDHLQCWNHFLLLKILMMTYKRKSCNYTNLLECNIVIKIFLYKKLKNSCFFIILFLLLLKKHLNIKIKINNDKVFIWIIFSTLGKITRNVFKFYQIICHLVFKPQTSHIWVEWNY